MVDVAVRIPSVVDDALYRGHCVDWTRSSNVAGSERPASERPVNATGQIVIDDTVIDVEFLGDGHMRTYLGTFNLDELERYVRGRNRAQDQSGGADTDPDSGLRHWPGVYNPSD
jgi:hypothetical protein